MYSVDFEVCMLMKTAVSDEAKFGNKGYTDSRVHYSRGPSCPEIPDIPEISKLS